MPGTDTSAVEVVQLTPFGLWLAVDDCEYFLPHEAFPWFSRAPVSSVFAVLRVGENHLQWPELDVDLTIESLGDPNRYPLIAD